MVEKLGYEMWGQRRVLKIRCLCGNVIQVPYFTNTCERCERDYNSSGQLLAPRSQWGAETGESLTDILNIDCLTPEECFEEDR